MKEAKNITLKFISTTYVMGICGAMTLRWLALALLYRQLPDFWTGVGTTIGSVVILASIVAAIMIPALKPIEKIAREITNGVSPTAEHQKILAKAVKTVKIWVVAENVAGFIVGQIAVSILDFVNGAVPYTASRFSIILVQATCVGIIASLYELFYLEVLLVPYRNLLNIHSMEAFGVKKVNNVALKVIGTVSVVLIFMGVNAMTAGYALLHGDNLPESSLMMSEYLKGGIICILFVFVECIGVIIIIMKDMGSRIEKASKIVSELEKSGNLSGRINITTADEVGVLISNQNELMEKLTGTINVLKKETNKVNDSAQVLTESSSKSLVALESVKQSVYAIESEDKKTNEIISSTYSDIESLKGNAMKVEELVVGQSLSIEQASNSIHEMVNSIANISDITKKADEVSEKLRVTSHSGSQSIKTAEEAIKLIQESSEAVHNAVLIIKKISGQTNLLAMNASIEAAHAGEFGQGFAVVADEVRTLAANSAKNVQTVNDYISDMAEKIENGVQAMQDAKQAFEVIDSGVEETADIVRSIAQAVDIQREGTEETLSATQEVVNSISSIKELASLQRMHTDNVYENTKNIVSSSQAITEALKQTSQAAVNLNEILSDVDKCAADNTSSIQKMKSQIEVFKTE